jgi:hypothetical protein
VKNRSLVIVLIAFTIRFMAGYCRGFFEPIIFAMNYPNMTLEYALANMAILVIAPIPGFFAISRYTDKREKTMPSVRPLLTAGTLITTSIVFPVMYWCGIFWLSMGCVFVSYLVGEVYLPIGFVITLNITTPRVRAL